MSERMRGHIVDNLSYPYDTVTKAGGTVMVTEEQIRALAYAMWEQEGCPEGKGEEHYYRAKQILEEQEATSGVSFEPPPPVINLPPTPRKRKSSVRRKKA